MRTRGTLRLATRGSALARRQTARIRRALDEGEVKVSARGTGPLVGRGLDLSAVMTEAAADVDGEGGGHDIAAGATIPAGREEAFLDAVERLIEAQLA